MLNQHQLRELRCRQCREPPPQDCPTIGLAEHSAPLPRPLAPITGETLASYLSRLASANHLAIPDLLTALPPWFRTKVRNHDDRSRHHMLASVHDHELNALADLTSQSPAALLTALPVAQRHGTEHLLYQSLIAHHEIRDQPVRAGTEPPPNHWRSRLQRLRNMNPNADTAAAHDEFVHASIYPEAVRRAAERLTAQQSRTRPKEQDLLSKTVPEDPT